MAEKEILELLITHAYSLLSRRPQSEFEIRIKLEQYGYKKNISDLQIYIDQVVELLKKQKYVNDEEFAKWFVEQRLLFNPGSKRRLSFELSKKGIDRTIIEDVLNNYDEESACRRVAEKNRERSREKLTDYLLRQGFGYDLIQTVL